MQKGKQKMTLEEMKDINLSAGRPPYNFTDEKWQNQLRLMRIMIPMSHEYKMRCSNRRYQVNGVSNPDEKYDGETDYQRYVQYINSVLTAVRKKETEYCYFIYQISDLLKFEPMLKARYMPEAECFAVSL